SRLWVVQEIAVAHPDPLLVCGTECAPWNAIEKL
ncbi:hypothetical protein G647_02557, partial [Cladophialophora carrionii CBS 160.54]